MKIHVTQPCLACDGQLQQLHPNWDEYHGFRRSFTEAEFFADLGYLPNEPRPPLLITCQKCHGTGEVEAWLPLDVVMPAFVNALRALRQGGKAA
jgi:hypothetical protein